jgi:UDP-3-O-[3-hydroxymyristoyl] glucosamine N-acyltransferase
MGAKSTKILKTVLEIMENTEVVLIYKKKLMYQKSIKPNTLCNVMHNSTIGDFTTIAPNEVILGNVKIGMSCYIGSNATILPNLELCENVIT